MRRQVPAVRGARRAVDVESLIQPVIDALSANVAILNLDASICAVNAAWRRFAEQNGCQSPAYCLGMDYLEVCRQAEHVSPEARITAAALAAVMAGTTASSSLSYTLPLEDGLHHFKLSISRITLPIRDCIVVSHEDVTAVIRLEEQRRAHAVELIETQDRERRQIARELHDTTAQHLTAIGLLSKIIFDRRHSEESTALFEELRAVVAQAQAEIRTLSYLLHPPLLAEVGLEVSLQRYVAGFSKRTGLEIDFHWGLAPGEGLGDDVEFAILRVVQEALANVHHHSGARSAEVRVEAAAGEVRVTIRDTGTGIGPAAEEGLGIPGMRSRVAELGGSFSVSRDSRGTCLLAVFPEMGGQGLLAARGSPSSRRSRR